MFMNNPASTRGPSAILANNENATTDLHSKLSSSSSSSNGMKKASFHDNTKTPHRDNEIATTSKGGQITQRRRRAFGDISNRKVITGGGGGAGGGKDNNSNSATVLKRTSLSTNLNQGSLLKSTTVLKPTTTNRNSTSQVRFSELPSIAAPSSNIHKARSGVNNGASISSSALPKPRTSSSSISNNSIAPSKTNTSTSEYDGVFSPTTRWADDTAIADNIRSPFYLVSEEEWNMVSDLRTEFSNLTQQESKERIRLENERDEQLFMKKILAINEEALGTTTSDVDDLGGTLDGLHLLDEKLPWEVDDDDDGSEYDPAEERRLSGNDPCSLWGDISNW